MEDELGKWSEDDLRQTLAFKTMHRAMLLSEVDRLASDIFALEAEHRARHLLIANNDNVPVPNRSGHPSSKQT